MQNISDGTVTVGFSLENNPSRVFYAKTPIADMGRITSEGDAFTFHLGFSYSGFRVWDMLPSNEGAESDLYATQFA